MEPRRRAWRVLPRSREAQRLGAARVVARVVAEPVVMAESVGKPKLAVLVQEQALLVLRDGTLRRNSWWRNGQRSEWW